MKHRYIAVAISLLTALSLSFSVTATPKFAQAQSTSSSAVSSSEGSSDFVPIEDFYRMTESDKIRSAIKRLSATRVESLPIPVLFGVSPANLTPNFGDPRSGGRTHEGEDILAAKGTPIVSPTEAVVLGVGVWSGAGNYVSTAAPGGETFVYMHLNEPSTLKAGDSLEPGDLIGFVGNTGNAAGGPAHLHFEIRKDGATDPYPRLKGEFSLAQKIMFTGNILDQVSDKATLAKFLVATYRSQFLLAQAAGLKLPSEIVTELSATAALGGGGAVPRVALPADLTVGSSGAAVTSLQAFLIVQNKGPAARALANAGATGSFGTITRNALIEYQRSVGINPADGYYGPLTRAFVQNTPAAASLSAGTSVNLGNVPTPSSASAAPISVPQIPSLPAVPPANTVVPIHDLTLGSSGAEVIWLQAFLIAAHSGPAAEALARSGATGYFGTITRNALAEYQAKNGIAPAAGYFGAMTRARISAAATR